MMPDQEIKISGAILSGGENKRMGRDKATLLFNNKTLLEYLSYNLKKVCDEIIIVSDNEAHGKFKITRHTDLVKHKGPTVGIYTSLSKIKNDYCLVIGCDMPFINSDLFAYLIKCMDYDFDVVIPTTSQKLQPLCAIYSKRCKKIIFDSINKNELKILSILDNLNVKYIEIGKDLEFYREDLFANINTPEDYKKIFEAESLK